MATGRIGIIATPERRREISAMRRGALRPYLFQLLAFALLAAAASCSEQDYDYCYSAVDGMRCGEPVELQLNMSASATYSIYFCATIKRELLPDSDEVMKLLLKFVSPAGRRYSDTLLFPTNATGNNIYSRTIDGVKNIECHYLKGVINRESGTWRIFAEPLEYSPLFERVAGIGMRTKRENI